jgi:hypothetical protein
MKILVSSFFHFDFFFLDSSLQLLASPLIVPPTLEHVLQANNNVSVPGTLQSTTATVNSPQLIKQEHLLQGA